MSTPNAGPPEEEATQEVTSFFVSWQTMEEGFRAKLDLAVLDSITFSMLSLKGRYFTDYLSQSTLLHYPECIWVDTPTLKVSLWGRF